MSQSHSASALGRRYYLFLNIIYLLLKIVNRVTKTSLEVSKLEIERWEIWSWVQGMGVGGRWGEILHRVKHLRYKTWLSLQSKLISVVQNGMCNAALPALLEMCILSLGLNRAVSPSLQTIWHHLLWHGYGQNRLLEPQSYFKTGKSVTDTGVPELSYKTCLMCWSSTWLLNRILEIHWWSEFWGRCELFPSPAASLCICWCRASCHFVHSWSLASWRSAVQRGCPATLGSFPGTRTTAFMLRKHRPAFTS